MELEISIATASLSFHRIPSKLYEAIAYHGGMQAIAFLAISQILQNFRHFEILNLGVNGKTSNVEYLEKA